MPSYDAIKNKQNELIRKALDGSVFLSAIDADPIETLTVIEDGTIALATLPTGWDDLGFLSTDGAAFARDVQTSETISWGSVTPTRSDIVTDTTTLTVVAQETKLLTIGLATGADLATVTPATVTGEFKVIKPTRPKAKHYRALAVAVDDTDAGEIYIARFLPRARVTSYAEQAFGGGDDPITWGVTLTGETDTTLGYSEVWLFGGPGWAAMLAEMGFYTLDFGAITGQDAYISMRLEDEGGNPFDLDGATMRLDIVTPDPETLIATATATELLDGWATAFFSSSETATWPAGTQILRLVIIQDSVETVLAEQPFEIVSIP